MGKSAKVLMLASVASMIDLFNKTTIAVLEEAGCLVDIAANFQFGSITSQIRVDEYKAELQDCGKNVYDIPIPRSVLDIKNIIRSYRLLVTLSNEKHYDIVHVHSPIGGILGRLKYFNRFQIRTSIRDWPMKLSPIKYMEMSSEHAASQSPT